MGEKRIVLEFFLDVLGNKCLRFHTLHCSIPRVMVRVRTCTKGDIHGHVRWGAHSLPKDHHSSDVNTLVGHKRRADGYQ